MSKVSGKSGRPKNQPTLLFLNELRRLLRALRRLWPDGSLLPLNVVQPEIAD
jgi:hypothetical protein